MLHDLWLSTTAYLLSVSRFVSSWPIWKQFVLVPAKIPASGSIFNFAEYLAALALLLVVLTASDFRFRYRLSLTKANLRTQGLWVAFGVGAAILAADVWFQNNLPVPQFLGNPNNIKAALAIIFLVFVFRVIAVALIRRPTFSERNAKQFFETNYHLVHEGNTERLQILAEELRASLQTIVATAARPPQKPKHNEVEMRTHQYAVNFLLLIGDERFCRVVVDKVPSFALIFFTEAQKHSGCHMPIYQFARNVGKEFISNVSSAYYQERSGYYSGLMGYTRPISHIVFGSYEFVERCATDGASPLDVDYDEFSGFNSVQLEGFSRASLIFLESYLKTPGAESLHSYALARMFHSFESALSETYRLNETEAPWKMKEYQNLRATIRFTKQAIVIVDKFAKKPLILRSTPDTFHRNIFDELADLIFETIFAASAVTSPVWTAWSIQHNAVWSEIFGFNETDALKLIAYKVRRLLYDEIKRMDEFPNFKGARILGFCLNVLGIVRVDRHHGFKKDVYPLQAAAIDWVKVNYRRLRDDHPKVANACLQGAVSYDAERHRLVKTYTNDTRKEPSREYLVLD